MVSAETKANPWFIAFIVSIATFMEVLDTTIVNVALTQIAGSLGATQEESTWIVTSYLVSNAIVLPLSGWLAGVFGRKLYFMMSIFFFTLTSFACGLAESLAMLVVFRFLQGISGGGLQPLQQAILLDVLPVEKRAIGFAITGTTVILAPVLGPVLGGYISDNFSWRWIFYINIPVGILALVLVNMFVYNTPHAQAKGFKNSIDFIGLGFIAVGLGTLQLVLDKGQIEDWFESNFIITASFVSAVSLVAAIFRLLKQNEPVVDLRLFRIRSYAIACFIMFIAGFVLYSSTVILPFLVQTQFNYDATMAGLVLSPGALVTLLMMIFVGKFSSKVEARYLIPFGFITLACGTYYTMSFSPETDYWTFVDMRLMQVMGLPFIFISISTIAYMDIPKESYNKASALFALSRNVGGSIGIAVATTVLSRSSSVWYSHLAERITANNPEYQDYLARTVDALLAHGVNPSEVTLKANAMIYKELIRQSTLMGYVECMHVILMIILLIMPILFLVPKNKLGAGGEKFVEV